MTEPLVFIDAGAFLGMHNGDAEIRERCLAFFRQRLASDRVRMNYEQIGICDAVIWRLSREVQDAYYPFMDRLHTDMAIQRMGYDFDDLHMALSPELHGLRPEQALLAAQTMRSDSWLFTHDPALCRLAGLRGRLFEPAVPRSAEAAFPGPLQPLYETSRCFVYADEH